MPTKAMDESSTPERNRTHELSDLERLYTDSEQVDKEQFAEMRSNLLLVAGEHYNRNLSQFFKRIRDHGNVSDNQKLRLTKNHIQRITKALCNAILSSNPGVGFRPKSESELQDTKAAELHRDVWNDGWERYNLPEKIDGWAADFVHIGEVANKLFYDPNAGPLLGYEPVKNQYGEPVQEPSSGFDDNGQPIPGGYTPNLDKPIFQGEICFEQIFGFNLFRPPECKDMRDAPWLIIRKMVDKNRLMLQFPDKAELIKTSSDDTFKVFDPGTKMGFRDSRKTETMVKEIYFPPGPDYPEGYYYIWSKETILDEGPLPGAEFPVQWAGYDKIQTSARAISPIKYLRPYQAEVNRAASKMAEHQITLGDDKIITQSGTKISAGVSLPGVRHINVTGAPPTIMPGRDGSQYLAYMEGQIQEMYLVADMEEALEPSNNGQQDPIIALFKSAKSKRRFQRNVARFERFLLDVARTYLKLAKVHFDDDRVIVATGKSELVNISEFKNTQDINFQIIIEPQTEDVEEKFGKQIMLQNALQFVGSSMDQEMVGKLLQELPFANAKALFSDLTQDRDSANNIILALDRGEMPAISQFDDPVKMSKRLVARMRQADFKLLAPPIQMAYQQILQQYQMMKVEQDKAILAAEAGFIPVDGPLVTVQGFFVRQPNNPTATQLVRLPHASIKWLIDTLEKQGQSLQEMEDMNRGLQAQQATLLTQAGKPMTAGQPNQGVENGAGSSFSALAGGAEGD